MMEKKKILEALSSVKDPKTGQSITKLNMVEDLEVDGNNVNFTLKVPQMDSLEKSSLNLACMSAVKELDSDLEVNVHMMTVTTAPGQSDSDIPQVKNLIAVASGKGGVGKSTVATNLALGLKELGASVGLIDADLYGPSIPTMMGLDGEKPKVQELHGKPRIVPLMAYDIPVMSIGFIVDPEQAVVLRGPRLAGIIKQFIQEVIWPELDYLVIDLPPGTGDIQLTLVQTVPVTGAVIVTTPQEVSVSDAVKAMNMFRMPNINVPILGVVENMSWFTPKELPENKYYIFGQGGGKKLAKMSESVVLGQVPLVQGIRESGDAGKPSILADEEIARDAFLQIAKNTARQVALRNEMLEPTKIVQMKS